MYGITEFGYKIDVEVVGSDHTFPQCRTEDCPFAADCANHHTAGDDRVEYGFSPFMTMISGDFYCEKRKSETSQGAVVMDKSGKLAPIKRNDLQLASE